MAADPTALEALRSGAADIVPEGGLEAKLALGRPLRVKLGVDPSRPDLTLGHTVVLRKLRQFQDAGHTAILIVGDFTARIGDPSGRSDTRPMLTEQEVGGERPHLPRAGGPGDRRRARARCGGNAEWSAGMDMGELLRLASVSTVAQMLEREDFRGRYQAGQPISVVEFLYPLFQGYDSVAVEADVELGGTDQTFNLLDGPRGAARLRPGRRRWCSPCPCSRGSTACGRCRSRSTTGWASPSRPRSSSAS